MFVNCGLFVIIHTPNFFMKGANLYVITNEKYDDEGANPNAATKLKLITAMGERGQRKVQRIKLKFLPDNDGIATDAIVEQTRKTFRDIAPGSDLVTVLGDGGNGVWLRAKQILNEEEPEHALDRTFIAPGGTMNLIAKALGSRLAHLPLFLVGFRGEQDILLRELIVDLKTGRQVHIPWAAFSGVGFDGHFLEHYEKMPRTHHVLRNVLKTSVDLAPQVLGADEQFVWDMALAVSQLGLIKFPPRDFDGLSKKDFYRVQLGPVGGTEAAIKGIALQVTGLHPAIADFYWKKQRLAAVLDFLPGHGRFREIIESVRPCISNGGHRSHQISGPFTCHADGFPHRFDAGADDYRFVTLPEPGVKVFSPGF